jgi:hypothetical protein
VIDSPNPFGKMIEQQNLKQRSVKSSRSTPAKGVSKKGISYDIRQDIVGKTFSLQYIATAFQPTDFLKMS